MKTKFEKHVLILPDEPEMPFAISFDHRAWEPGYPIHTARDYFLVYEAAKILVAKKIIRRDDVKGIQQTRKWIRETENFPKTHLYKNSKKYGYLIPKMEFANYFSKMTGGDPFDENEWKEYLLGLENDGGFITYKVREFKEKVAKLLKEIESGKLTLDEQKKKESQHAILEEKAQKYRQRWYKAVLLPPEMRGK